MAHDLLLAEELLLLSLHDEKGSDETWSSLDPGLAGVLHFHVVEKPDGALLEELPDVHTVEIDQRAGLICACCSPTCCRERWSACSTWIRTFWSDRT